MGALLKRRLGSLLAGRGKDGLLTNKSSSVLGAGSVGSSSPTAAAVDTPTITAIMTLPFPCYVVLR